MKPFHSSQIILVWGVCVCVCVCVCVHHILGWKDEVLWN